MKTRTLYNRRKMFIACLLSLALLTGVCVPPSFSNVYTIEAQANPLVPIGGFLGKLGTNITLAETIISSLLSAGAGVTNTAWLNELNNAYGTAAFSIGEMYSQGLFEVVEDVSTGAYTIIDNGFIDAVESVSAYHNLGIDTLFEVTAEDQNILPGIAAASGGTTLLKTILGGVTLGTVGAAAAAVGGGVVVGVLAAHAYDMWQDYIKTGANIKAQKAAVERIAANGGRFASINGNNAYPNGLYYYIDGGIVPLAHNASSSYVTCNFVRESGTTGIVQEQYGNNGTLSTRTFRNDEVSASTNGNNGYSGFVYVPNADYANTVSSIKNGTYQDDYEPISPDLIGRYGNMKGNDNFQTPLEDDEGISFVPWQDYIDDFVDPANTNTNDNLPDDNEDVFRDFISPYITPVDPVPTPTPTPDPSPTVPTDPEDVTADPITDPVPQQPDYDDKPELTTEDIADGGPYTTPNLLDKFPFCIPKDIHDLFAVMASGSRSAPRIKFDYVSEYFDYELHIDIDLAAFDDAAAIFRLLELILFILGLALATKNLIRW